MTRPGVLLTMSQPASAGTSAEATAEHERWYQRHHIPDVLRRCGLTSARQYRLAVDDEQLAPTLTGDVEHRYVTVYEIDDVSRVGELREGLREVAAMPSSRDGDAAAADPAADLIATVYEQISENTTKATLPPGIEAPRPGRVSDGPPGAVIIFSRPSGDDAEAEYHRWYDGVHTGETLLLPGYTRSRRFRPAPADEQALPDRVDTRSRRFLTIYDLENVRYVPHARAAMAWFREVSVQFTSPAVSYPPSCWTFEQLFETAIRGDEPRTPKSIRRES